MKKYIHYCWFGGKPLPKLAKKCIKSWKKYLPDFEIMLWNEENSNLDECAFVKEAYENKKWAFVADYVRTKAMCEYGGIYFDTDMEIIKPIDELLDSKKGFLGVEDSHMIACGVWYEPKPKSYLSEKLLEFYRSQEYFEKENMYKISIPRLISGILKDFDSSNFETQTLKHDEVIYKREYFYPLSYNHQYNIFTENTCMIHYYDASWTPKWEQKENKIFRILGKEKGKKFIEFARKSKRFVKKGLKLIFYPLYKINKRKKIVTKEYIKSINDSVDKIKKSKYDYIAFYNPDWFGVANATKELFDNSVPLKEIYRNCDINKVLKKIVSSNYKKVVFSGFCIGWKKLSEKLNEKGIVVQTYFHGSHSQVLEPYGWTRNMEIYELAKKGIVKKMAICKESLINFYNNNGCNTYLLSNKVNVKKYPRTRKDDKIVIGIYAAKTDNFRKNAFVQIAAAALLKNKNVKIDMVPINNNAKKFAKFLGVEIDGINHPISREELFKRLANCDISLYVTYSECAPMSSLESFAQDTICIVGNNCHYFKNEEIEKYIVVNEENNPEEIANKIKYALANKEKILKLYKKWEDKNTNLSNRLLQEFLEDGDKNEK